MTKPLHEIMNVLPKEHRARIERRGKKLLDDYVALVKLRKSRNPRGKPNNHDGNS